MTETNVQILLKSRPEGLPQASDFERRETPIPEPADGDVLVRNLYLSLDPAMRGWMADRKSYVPPVGLGEVMRGLTVGVVEASRHSSYSEGDRVTGVLGWQLYATAAGEQLDKLPPEGSPELFLGPLGMTGMTAYFGLLEIGQPRAGETVLVSAAAGAVGSLVGQIATIKDCRAVGIAGTDEKCRWLCDELGFAAAINYKTTTDLVADIRRHCPRGVDVYFDNVGGPILDAALSTLARGARIPLCGAISQYNATEPVAGPTNYLALLVQRARMEGFIVFDFAQRYHEAQADLGRWLAAGRIRWRADVVEGLDSAPEALLKLFDGRNTGKLMVRLAEG